MKRGIAVAAAVLVVPAALAVGVLGLLGLGTMTALLGGSSGSSSGSTTAVGSVTWDSSAVPEEYREIVLKAGSICDEVTPSVIAAQIEAESNWQPTAASGAGAVGIAQFMPSTWAGAGMDGDGDGKADINNAIDQIWSQGNYMCTQRETLSSWMDAGSVTGDILELTLASYNAGLGAVQTYGGIPPYTETQGYVTRIVNLARTKYAQVDGVDSNAIIEAAEQYIGLPYVWGSNDPEVGLDCSGFVQRTFADLGVSLPRTADEMANMSIGQTITDRDQLQPGDIVAFRYRGDFKYHHVALYIGGGRILHASGYSRPLGYDQLSIYDNEDWIAKRVIVEEGEQ